jgi:putative intracellular protease/amidase
MVEDFYTDKKIISAVCHGPAGLLQATDQDGNSIFKDEKITSFTNNEESTVGLTKVGPFSLDDRMSGKFENGQDFKPFIVSNGQLITGQNPKIFISCC